MTKCWFPIMKNPNKCFLCGAAFFIAFILMASDELPKEDLVEIEKIVFEKSEHRSDELLRLIDDTFTRIRRGENFRELAAKVSDNPVNDRKQLVATKFFVRPIQNAVKRLEPGDTSDLIVTDKCYFIVQLVRRSKVNGTEVKSPATNSNLKSTR